MANKAKIGLPENRPLPGPATGRQLVFPRGGVGATMLGLPSIRRAEAPAILVLIHPEPHLVRSAARCSFCKDLQRNVIVIVVGGGTIDGVETNDCPCSSRFKSWTW